MQVAFYRAGHGNLLDLMIATWTKGPYSHCELVLDDGTFFSSRFGSGVGFKKIKHDPKDWMFIDIGPETPEVLEFCKLQVGKGYDLFGALGFVFRKFRTNKHLWFCSEIVTAALQHKGILLDQMPCKVSPDKLASLLLGEN